jgi:hypothetical protein
VHGTYAKATVTATIEPQAREVTQQIELGTGGTLEGTVRDPATGAPIRGALVLPQQGMMPDTERGESTNEQGYYRIEHLPAGTHMVIVLPMDGDSDDPQRAQAELVGRMKMQSIEVADGKTAVLDFPAPQQITVSGMIKRGSRAIEGSVMWVRQDGATMVTAQSDPSGSYKVELPKAGNYTVIITPKGQTLEPGTMPGASLAITVPEGESVVSKDLVLQDERWTGVVRDGGSGQPLGGASLMALPIDDRGAIDDRRAGVMRTATTQPDGSFEMDSPTAGRWRVSVAKGGYGTVYLDDLELSEGEVPDEVDVALFPSREMTLRIVNEGGAAIDGAMAFNLSAFSAADFGNVSGQDGQLRLLTLGDGSHNLIVFATGYAPHPLRDLVIDEHSAGSSLEVVLTTGSPVRVKVVDEGREPVKGANLTTLFAPGLGDLGVAFSMGTMMSGRSLATGTDGIVTLIPLEPGEYEVGAAAGDRRGRQSFKVKAREPSEVTLVIR